jgi:hypothetical protein
VSFEQEINHIGPGWQPIVRELHQKVLHIDPDLEVLQIKEKFGGLRYYYNSKYPYQSDESNTINDLVAEAEQKCDVTCEECGEPGENKSILGWYRTLCPSHHLEATEAAKRRRGELK